MINLGFWGKLRRPILALAPLDDVTDAPYRRIIAQLGKPEVLFTEFVSADGLNSPAGRLKLAPKLYFTAAERPIVAQLFSSQPTKMRIAAKLCAELGFDGVDINMGCPDETVEKQGSGAALIKNPRLARELIEAVKAGAPDLPVSVKTRIGYSQIDELEDWLKNLLAAAPAALVFHLRTRKEMSKVPAHWEVMPKIMEIAKNRGTLILGNGDIETVAEAKMKSIETGCDGVMLGRAIFGKPWLFAKDSPSLTGRLKIMLNHAKLFEQTLPHKNFAVMRKHFRAYAEDFPGAASLRAKLMTTADAAAAEVIVADFLAAAKLV